MENLDDQIYQKIFQFILGNDAKRIFKVNGKISLVNKHFRKTFCEYVNTTPLTLVLKFDRPNMDDNGDKSRYRKIIEMRKLTSKIRKFGASVRVLHACIFDNDKIDFVDMLQSVDLVKLKQLSISLQGPSHHDVYGLFENCPMLTHLHIHDRTRRHINERLFIGKKSLEFVSLCAYRLPEPCIIQAILTSLKIRSLRLTGLGYRKTVLPSLKSKSLIILRLDNVTLDRKSFLDFSHLKLFIAFKCIFPSFSGTLVKQETANAKKIDGIIRGEMHFGMLPIHTPYLYYKTSQDTPYNWANFSSDCRFVLQDDSFSFYGH